MNAHKNDLAALSTAELRSRAGPAGGRAAAGSGSSWPGRWSSSAAAAGRRDAGAREASCTGRMSYLSVAGRMVYVPAALADAVRARLEVSGAAAGGAGGDLGDQPGAAGPAGAGLADGRGPARCRRRARRPRRAGGDGRVLANMAESALAAPAGARRPAVIRGESEGDQLAPGARGDRVRPPVDPGAGPRAHRVHAAPVRPGRAGGPAGLGRRRHRGDRRRSGPVRAQRHRPGRVQAAGRPGVPGRGRGGVRAGGLPAGPLQRRPGPAAGAGPPDRHPGHRRRRRL